MLLCYMLYAMRACMQPSAGPVAALTGVQLLSCDMLCSLLARVSSWCAATAALKLSGVVVSLIRVQLQCNNNPVLYLVVSSCYF
jgi:hypothetical protein